MPRRENDMSRKDLIIEEMVRNAGVDPGRILGGENIGSEEPVEEGTVNFKFYHAAKDAEDRFEKALRKQYGKDYQDKRYTGKGFNKETQAAYDAFLKASDAWRNETRRARGESVEEDKGLLGGVIHIIKMGEDRWVARIAKPLGVAFKDSFKGASGHEALMKMAKDWSKTGFME